LEIVKVSLVRSFPELLATGTVNNLLLNSYFAVDGTSWDTRFVASGVGSAAFGGGTAVITITNGGTQSSSINVFQLYNIVPGNYLLTIKAKTAVGQTRNGRE
jgi:hypothetical protein